MGSPKERESQISNIISYLGLSTIGELIWVQRTLENNFQNRLASTNDSSNNIYEQKKKEIEHLMTEHESLLSKISNLQQETDSSRKQTDDLKNELESLSEDKKVIENEIPDRLKEAVASFEKEHIKKILKRTSMSKEETAKILGISVSSLYRKMDEYNIN